MDKKTPLFLDASFVFAVLLILVAWKFMIEDLIE